MSRGRSIPLRYILVGIWVVFTLSLSGWWFYFSLEQVGRLMELEHGRTAELVRQQKMIFWEGSTLIAVVLAGGGALLYYMLRTMRESRRIQEFLTAFTHEIKTPISSLMLQAEMLKERLGGRGHDELLDRLLREAGRLNLQLENSLFLTGMGRRRLLAEVVPVGEVLHAVGQQFAELELRITGEAAVLADRSALNCVLANIFRNSVVHGRATAIDIEVVSAEAQVILSLHDNGGGVTGDRAHLGRLFGRPYAGSGTGIGLYLVGVLAREMGGSAAFDRVERGFLVRLTLPRA